MKARIYRPSKTATQSGLGKGENWVLEYEPGTARKPEALMGWTASGDTANQVKMKFPSLGEAQAYADSNGISYDVQPAHERKVRPRNYGDNFKYIPEEKN